MTEDEQLLADLRATYSELFPKRDPNAMWYDDSLLALGVLLLRAMRQPACAPLQGTQTLRAFTPRGRILEAMAKFNPKDPE